MKTRLSILALCLTIGMIGFLALDRDPADDMPLALNPTPVDPRPAETTTTSPADDHEQPLSPMAKRLHREGGSPEEDLKALGDIFRYHTLEPSGQIPTGTNREITRALCAPSEMGLPYLPATHPAINESGELVDRWEVPYFFHALSSRKMEIRSAGPDRVMYTRDDLIWPEPRQPDPGRQTKAVDLGL